MNNIKHNIEDLKMLISIVSAVFPLEHFEAGWDGDTAAESWQYDGGLDGVVVSLTPYTNVNRVFSVHIDVHMPEGDSFHLWSAPVADVNDRESVEQLKHWLRKAKQGVNPF